MKNPQKQKPISKNPKEKLKTKQMKVFQRTLLMDKTSMRYFEEEDVLHIVVGDGEEARSIELGSNITVELDSNDQMIGVEILHASAFLRDTVLDSVHAKTLKMLELTPA